MTDATTPAPSTPAPIRPGAGAQSISLLLWLTPLLLAPLLCLALGRLEPDALSTALVGMLYSALVVLPLSALFGRAGLLTGFWFNVVATLPVVGYIALFGYLPSIATVYVVMETKLSELQEFAGDSQGGTLLGAGIYLAACIACGWLLTRRRAAPPSRAAVAIVVAVLALGLALKWVRIRVAEGNPHLCGAMGFAEYREQRALQAELAAHIGSANAPRLARTIAEPASEVHICIIGESASSWHQQLYGYERATTPRLSARDDLYVFRDAITRYTHTAQAIPSMLLTYPDENASDPADQPITASLVAVLRASGFKTFWLSNQDPAGIYDNIATTIGQSCDETRFNVAQPRLDGALLPMLDDALADPAPRKVIFLHLMGSHSLYAARYPEESAAFPIDTPVADRSEREAGFINHYDNSTVYTDQVVDAVIERVAREDRFASVLYTSDHGEDVYDVTDRHQHTEQFATAPVYEIPFVLWLSPEMRAARADLAAGLPGWLDRPFVASAFAVSYLDLLALSGGPCDPTRSIFSPAFVAKPRLIGKRDYDRDIKPLATRSEILRKKMAGVKPAVRARLWAHRVNSLGKLAETAAPFGGVEIDVVYQPDTATFDVTHPPAPSIGLGLDRMFAALAFHDSHVWLDMKDMTPAEAGAASAALAKLVKEKRIDRARLITESSNMEALAIFKQAGFTPVWYSPTGVFDTLRTKPREQWSADEVATLERQRADLARLGIEQISGEAGNLALLETSFPDAKHFRIWGGGLDIDDLGAIADLLGKHPKVACFLVRYKSAFTR